MSVTSSVRCPAACLTWNSGEGVWGSGVVLAGKKYFYCLTSILLSTVSSIVCKVFAVSRTIFEKKIILHFGKRYSVTKRATAAWWSSLSFLSGGSRFRERTRFTVCSYCIHVQSFDVKSLKCPNVGVNAWRSGAGSMAFVI
ncbi:hypothetical protein AVEN_136615-1 [Araneus ventricosus]|uniref:Uncharacterized protein n=1 Tax=Araneus ventricosus TaxID=182803 RepID=A0A4Y2CB22_ARAVE|nr:hypothetical protein AVEN_136615-1 [Araneus ventricosus]